MNFGGKPTHVSIGCSWKWSTKRRIEFYKFCSSHMKINLLEIISVSTEFTYLEHTYMWYRNAFFHITFLNPRITGDKMTHHHPTLRPPVLWNSYVSYHILKTLPSLYFKEEKKQNSFSCLDFKEALNYQRKFVLIYL